MLQSLLWNLPAYISAIALIFSFIIKGYVPPHIGGLGLLGLFLFIFIGSRIGRLVPFIVRFLFPFVSLLLLAIIWSGGDYGDMSTIFALLVLISVMLFGFYIMIFGVFRRRESNPFNNYDFFVIISAVGLIIGLIIQNIISFNSGIIALILIVVFLALGRGVGSGTGWWVRILFRYGLPLFSLLIMLTMLLM